MDRQHSKPHTASNTGAVPVAGRSLLASSYSRWLVGVALLWFALLFLLLVGLAMRRHFNHDEHQFVASAAVIAQYGLLPYRDFPYFHVPNLSFLYALVFQFTDFLLLGARMVSSVSSWLLMVLLCITALRWLRNLRPNERLGVGLLLTLLLTHIPSFRHASGAAWNHDLPVLLTLLASTLQVAWLRRTTRPAFWLLPIGWLAGSAAGIRSSYLLTLPVFALALFLGLNWRQRQFWFSLAWLGIGSLAAVLPVLYTFWQAPAEFLFGNWSYARLNTAYYAAVGTTAPMSIGHKGVQTLLYLLEPGNLLVTALAGAALVRSQWRIRFNPELLFLLLLLASLLAGAFAPTPLQPQYIYALFPTLALLLLAALARTAQPRFSLRAIGAAGLVTVLLALPRDVEGLAILFEPAEWLPLKVHARGEYLASLAGEEPVVTLAPTYVLEGKKPIDPAFVTGPFGWRVAPLLEPAERARFGLKGAEELAARSGTAPPQAILTGIHDNDAESEQALLDYAAAQGYAPMAFPGQGTLWLLPKAAWGETIVLAAALLPQQALIPGQSFLTTFYLQARQPIHEDLNVLVRLVAPDGSDLLRSEGWPWGRPTHSWVPGEIWPDGHRWSLPLDARPGPYRVEVSFYSPATLELLDTPVTAGYLIVADEPPEPLAPQKPLAVFAEGIVLTGLEIPAGHWTAGQTVPVQLSWQATAPHRKRYTTFVHLVGPAGLMAQHDQEPFGGFYPTSDWLTGISVTDHSPLALPADLPPGEYQLWVGLYDSNTGQRLAWLQDGGGDAFAAATVQVR
jgi:hypothetical protein